MFVVVDDANLVECGGNDAHDVVLVFVISNLFVFCLLAAREREKKLFLVQIKIKKNN